MAAPEVYTKASDITVKRGQFTTVTADDTVSTGLKSIDSVIVSLDDDPVATDAFASALIGVGGDFSLKTWNSTFGAATVFGVKVNWIAIGPGA